MEICEKVWFEGNDNWWLEVGGGSILRERIRLKYEIRLYYILCWILLGCGDGVELVVIIGWCMGVVVLVW